MALSIGAQKLGQPEPLSYFVLDFEQIEAAAGAGISARPLLAIEGTGKWRLGEFLAQYHVLPRVQQLAPFRFGARDLEGVGCPEPRRP